MCNRFHQSEKTIVYLQDRGVAESLDFTFPPPRIFPTGMKTARSALVVTRANTGNRPLELQSMEWGVPVQVAGKREGTKLNRFVTNARNLASPFWRNMVATPARRCLVPFTHFAEPHPEGGKGDDGQPKQAWFSLPDRPVGVFAGLWRPVTMPSNPPRTVSAFAFATTGPNDFVRPWHPKAMPVILHEADFDTWLEGDGGAALDLIRPYSGKMDVQIETPSLA